MTSSLHRQPSVKKRVLLIVMPWAPPIFPSLGAALLRTILVREEIDCDIFYGNLVFSGVLGGDPFLEQQFFKFAFSEIAFTPYYFDMPQYEAASRLYDHAAALTCGRSTLTLGRYQAVVARAGECLDNIVEKIAWDSYDIVGFSVMMQQTVPSLALARRIKKADPTIRVLFGGPNCSQPMGAEILRCFPEVDLVVEGEADTRIAPLVREVREGSTNHFRVPGVYYRASTGRVCGTAPAQPVFDINDLPVPDYTPFFEQVDLLGLDHVQPYLQLETSRGCWWGEKHHCSFCSLQDDTMKFRAKSEDRVLKEILTLAERHKYTDFFPTDSIMHHRFYKTLLPQLGRLQEERALDFSFFFEMKSNIGREHAQALRYAGVNHVQPGIESFSDHVLELMEKGSTGIQQLQCLKALAECGIAADWNLIIRNPNENARDYRELIDMIPAMHHLPPLHEDGMTPMLLMRFSPYFERPSKYGITNVRPGLFYKDIYPDPEIDLKRLAFYFEYDHPDHQNEELGRLYGELGNAVDLWRRCYKANSLLQIRGPGFVQIVDRRVLPIADGDLVPAQESIVTLESPWAEIFSYCDEVRSETSLIQAFGDIATGAIREFIDRMVKARLMYRSPNGKVISLPLLEEAGERSGPLVPCSAVDVAAAASVS